MLPTTSPVSNVFAGSNVISLDLHRRCPGGVIFARSVPPGVDASYDTYASHYRHLREGLAHIDVCVLDYLIVTDSVISLAEAAVADQRGNA